jgi:crotonobetainyl-CoA:carnitine CoA-transferase CaiB-like acyl-CoA transferase
MNGRRGHPTYDPRVPRPPLAGVRVVDLTTVVAGPYATLLLADLGADVIKVESPSGDVARDLGPRANAGMAAVFLNCNRAKRSVVLDLTTAEGRDALLRLCDSADVFVHNLRDDSARRCGADAATLRARHPELIHCSIRGFGSGGPYRDLPAYDDIVQAAAGIAGAQEWMTGEPSYVVNAVGDKVSGLTAALAIAAALHRRVVDGDGAVIEVPMAETLTAFGLVEHLWGRTFVPPRGEARYPRMATPARRPFPTADGHLSVVVYSDRNWRDFFALIGEPELADEERYSTLEHRTAHLDELYGIVAEHLRRDTTAAWFARLTEAGIPAAPYNRVDDLFDDAHLDAVGFWEETEHPTEGTLLQCPTPVTFDGVRAPVGVPAPRLGADTDAVLAELAAARGAQTGDQTRPSSA